MNHWLTKEWCHVFMIFTSISGLPSECGKKIKSYQNRQRVFQSSTFQFLWSLANYNLNPLSLSDRKSWGYCKCGYFSHGCLSINLNKFLHTPSTTFSFLMVEILVYYFNNQTQLSSTRYIQIMIHSESLKKLSFPWNEIQ